jgi:hypothetical protein
MLKNIARSTQCIAVMFVGLCSPVAIVAASDFSYSPSGAAYQDSAILDPGLVPDTSLEDAKFRCQAAIKLPPPNGNRAAALGAAKASLRKHAGAAALRKFAASKAYRDPRAIPASVMAAFATGRPAAALAASLRGAELEPRQPRHLVNAAVVLMGYGELKSASGLLAVAAKVKGSGVTLGLTSAQHLRAAQAELAVATGQFKRAESLYRTLAPAIPTRTINRGLAEALACQGQLVAARARLARSERELFDVVETGDLGGETTPPVVNASPIDESAGKEIVAFGDYYRPVDPDDAAAHQASYAAAAKAAFQRSIDLSNSGLATFATMTPAGQRYRTYAQEVVNRDPEIARLNLVNRQIVDEYINLVTDVTISNNPCFYAVQHAALWANVNQKFTNNEKVARRLHKLYTATAASASDPAANRSLNLAGDSAVASFYYEALTLADLIASAEKREVQAPSCRSNRPPGGGPGQETPEDTTPAADPCSAARFERLKIKFGKTVSAEVNCEGGKIEVVPVKWGIEQAYIGAFGEAGVKWKSGDVTVASGVKLFAGINGVPGLPEVSIGAKAAVYLTSGPKKTTGIPVYGETPQKWAVKDWGIRIQKSVDLPGPKAGIVTTVTKFDDKLDISLVGAFD